MPTSATDRKQRNRTAAAWPAILIAIAACGYSPAPAAQERPGGFHSAASDPERALERVLKRADADLSVLDNLFGGRGERAYRPSVDYATMLTRDLRSALLKAETEQVRRDCKGRYQTGEVCGLDYNPVTCAQDAAGARLFSTLTPGANRIAVSGSVRGPAEATYLMAEDDGRWKIDGIACTSGASFNMR